MHEDLIDRIYEAAALPDLWPSVLDSVTEIGNGDCTLLFTVTREDVRWTYSAKGGWCEDYAAKGWPEKTDRPFRLLGAQHAGFLGDLDVYTREELDREPVYRDYLRPLGLGWGVATAIGVKAAMPDRPVLSINGDGGFMFTMTELSTAVRFKLPFTCVIGNDGGWGQIRSPQVSFFGEARTVATSLPTTRYDRMVEALGGRGAYVTDPREIGPALERALASDEVWCVNVVLDPEAYRKSGQVSMAI